MSTLKVTNIQHGSATNTAMVLDTAGTVKAYSTISVGNVTPSSSGAGITFPATASASSDANTLDDYEEGTFTPSLGGNTTYNNREGYYTKIGNVVFIRGFVQVTTLGTGSVRQISGLPFTSANLNGYEAAIAVSYFANSATNIIFATIGVNCGATTMDVIYTTAATATMTSNGTFFGNSARIDFSGCYTV